MRMKAVIGAMSDVLVLLNVDGKIASVNPAYEKMTGYEESEVVGKDVADVAQKLIKPEDLEKVMGDLRTTLEGKSPPPGTCTLVTRGGREVSVAFTSSFIKGAEGKPTAIVATIKDITELKRVEKELKIKDSAIASSINSIALADLEGNLTYVNPSFFKLWGYNNEKEVLGKSVAEFGHKREKALEVIEVLRERGSWVGELVAIRKDGSLFHVELSASMVTDEAGKPICMMSSFMDITERKRADEERLKAAADKQRIEQLEKFARVAVGRELKMIEQKERIETLESKLKEITEK